MGYVGQYRETYEEGSPCLLRGRGHWIPDQVANCCPTVASVEGSWTAGAVCKARWAENPIDARDIGDTHPTGPRS
jgi:hypothetical protein